MKRQQSTLALNENEARAIASNWYDVGDPLYEFAATGRLAIGCKACVLQELNKLKDRAWDPEDVEEDHAGDIQDLTELLAYFEVHEPKE